MNRFALKIITFVIATLLSFSIYAGSVNLQVRDVMTNISIDANVEVAKHKYHLNAFEPFQANLPNGIYTISISADGYKSMETDITVGSNAPSEFRFMLDPLPSQKSPVKKQSMRVKDAINTPVSNFYGYVTDSLGAPLAGVNVQAVESVISTSTDARGYFSFDVPIPVDIENPTQTLTWSLPNHKTLRRSNVLLMNEAQGYKIELPDGKGQIDIKEHENQLVNQPISLSNEINEVTVTTSRALLAGADKVSPTPVKARPFITPSPTIRVEISCKDSKDSNCKKIIEALPLETYVAIGLGSEWFFNKPADNGQKAGAIAYRSYAANKIAGAKNKAFDICNTDSCQVFNPEIIPTSSVTSAVQETAGFMLTKNGKTPSFSEYALITNDNPYPTSRIYYADTCQKQYDDWKVNHLSTTTITDTFRPIPPKDGKCLKVTSADRKSTGCGNGNSGEPKGGWWCLKDEVQKDLHLSGHGRGMSQQGSQNWAQAGKDWSWILWHYYQQTRDRPFGVKGSDPTPYQEISSPIDTSKNLPTVDKTTASTNDTIKLTWKVNNTSEVFTANLDGTASLTNLFLIAKLEQDKNSTLLENTATTPLTLAKGEKDLTSSFTIPSTVTSGKYKLKIQLWLDVNKDNKVNIEKGDDNTDLLLGENDKLEITIESKGTGYTKIANDGSTLPDSAILGTKPKDWACTKDNKTGLIWEVKTNDGGLRDSSKRYTWYDPNPATNGYTLYCSEYPNSCKPRYDGDIFYDKPEYFVGFESNGQNTLAYTKAVNEQGLCGSSNWRLPTNLELVSLVYCSDGKYETLGVADKGNICKSEISLTNITYFPAITNNTSFWSSSIDAYVSYGSNNSSGGAGYVNFWYYPAAGYGNKGSYGDVQLVR
ncbi:MAG: DUF1566 domain-containing protein [Methylococcales bacterium]|nr:DUF1566 domain-containing protein [Methylococcales bacterium]